MTDPYDRTAVSDTQGAPSTEPDEAYCSACNQSYGLALDVCPKDGARLIKLKATRDVMIGRVFDGRYELRTALGQGGMGTVYRAHQISVDREVAIKVIHPKLASDRVAVKRFLREARLASRLSQPNVVNVYDFGQTDDGILYLVMELLRGSTLARELESLRPLPLRRVTGIALQLCDALEVAHAQGIIHRDLKPGNVIVLDDPPGRDLIKVLDFGLAKSLVSDTSSLITASSALLGTPLYMPPEQIDGTASDQRADIYAFGCILHQMLVGKPPFVRDSVNAVLAAHLHEAPPALPATVPGPLAEIVAAMMAKRPEDRPASAAQVRSVLEALGAVADLADTVPVPGGFAGETTANPIALARTDAAGVRPAARRSRRPFVIAGGLAAVALAAGLGVMATHHAGHTPPPADAAMPVVPTAVPVDAAPPVAAPVVIDAAVVAPAPDAAVRTTHPPVHKRPQPPADAAPPPPHVDAGMPSIDFTK
jgi:tRNA A-37 threonylcarbamoyl transferase component Bud32